jgi:undecaprenyl-diphosphatase
VASISLLYAIILGIVQGITEFLPVSSSGHLVIFQNLFGMKEPQVFLDVMLHVGTLAAVFIVFRGDILELIRAALRIAASRRLGGSASEKLLVALIVGSVPTALIGFLFAEQIERIFASMIAAGVGLLITGSLLMLTEWKQQEALSRATDGCGGVGVRQALVVGVAQGIAIAPGISRSGSTITVGLLVGLPRETAARFSFLLSIPAIFGALLFELKDYSPALSPGAAGGTAVFVGALVAAAVGIVSLTVLLKVVKQGKISLFAYYCWAIGALAVIAGIIKG